MMIAQPVSGVRVMIVRRLTLAFAFVGLAHASQAADYGGPILRGSDVFAPGPALYANWGGLYVGGQAGYTYADSHSRIDTVLDNPALPGWPTLSTPLVLEDSIGATSYGGFVGYNVQFENLIVGIEANYNRATIDLAAAATGLTSDPIGSLSASSAAHLTDYGTLRLRAGWAMGRFMPYVFGGAAVGRAEFTDSARLQYTHIQAGVPIPVNVSQTSAQASTMGYGLTGGIGFDMMLMGGLFLRGEYELIQFASFGSAPAMLGSLAPFGHEITLNTVRGAVGFKF
jgi:opacity protein-like surface antigen